MQSGLETTQVISRRIGFTPLLNFLVVFFLQRGLFNSNNDTYDDNDNNNDKNSLSSNKIRRNEVFVYLGDFFYISANVFVMPVQAVCVASYSD